MFMCVVLFSGLDTVDGRNSSCAEFTEVVHFSDFCLMFFACTRGSMNSLFSDFFTEFWRGIFGGARDYVGEMLGGF